MIKILSGYAIGYLTLTSNGRYFSQKALNSVKNESKKMLEKYQSQIKNASKK
jgi:hypothetical protein